MQSQLAACEGKLALYEERLAASKETLAGFEVCCDDYSPCMRER